MQKLSIVVPTNKPDKILSFCQRLNSNIDLEVIFVGPCPTISISLLPVKFIYSEALPALCWEIGCRAATGNFLCPTCDDVEHSPGFFEDAIAILELSNNIYDMVTARFTDNEGELLHIQMMLGEISMPLTGVDGIYFTKGYHQVGGIDKRFLASVWDVDLNHRLFVEGGRPILLPGHTIHEHTIAPQADLSHHPMYTKYCEHDKAILRSLWWQDGKPTLTRSSLIQSFSIEEVGQICHNSMVHT